MLDDISQEANSINGTSEQRSVGDHEFQYAIPDKDALKPRSRYDVIWLVVQVVVLFIAVCQLLFNIMPYITGQDDPIVLPLINYDYSIGNYLQKKYSLEKNQYSIVSEKDDDYYLIDKSGNKFRVTNYGTKSAPNYTDNYEQHLFEKDVLKLLSNYTDLTIAHMSTDYELFSPLYGYYGNGRYDSDPISYIKAQTYPKNTSYPIRLWIFASDSNYESILKAIEKDIVLMSDVIGCGIKIYEVKGTVTDFNLDYTWNEKAEYYSGHVLDENTGQYTTEMKYSKDPFYYVVLYNKFGKNNFIIDAKTDKREYYWGDNL